MNGALDRAAILALVPHQGRMCLLDEVLDWDAQGLRCRSRSHQAADHPLRGPGGRLRALHLCEYGAQAMAVHGGLLARARGSAPAAGLLVALRAVRLAVAFVDDLPGPLQVEAGVLLDAPGSWQYQFQVAHAGQELARGRAAVMLAPGLVVVGASDAVPT